MVNYHQTFVFGQGIIKVTGCINFYKLSTNNVTVKVAVFTAFWQRVVDKCKEITLSLRISSSNMYFMTMPLRMILILLLLAVTEYNGYTISMLLMWWQQCCVIKCNGALWSWCDKRSFRSLCLYCLPRMFVVYGVTACRKAYYPDKILVF